MRNVRRCEKKAGVFSGGGNFQKKYGWRHGWRALVQLNKHKTATHDMSGENQQQEGKNVFLS